MSQKVWFLNHYATNMYYDGGGRHFWFAKNMKSQGYEPAVFCASTIHNSEKEIDTEGKKYIIKKNEDVPFVFVKTPSYSKNGKKRLFNMIAFYFNLLTVSSKFAKDNGNPDVVIASSPHPLTLLAGLRIAKRFKVPCICEVRDLWPEAIFAIDKAKENSLLGKILTAGEKWIYKKASALVFTKEGDTDYLLEKQWNIQQGGDIDLDKAFYINNGVDLVEFDNAVQNNKLMDDDLTSNKFKVVYSGSLRVVNDVGILIDAAKILKDHEDIEFLIYGEGHQKEFLQKRVENENLEHVKIKGFIDMKYIPFVLSKSNVNILNYSPHKYNWTRGNSSRKLFEYMASGKPIISTVQLGYSIIEKYNCGVELKQATPQALANAILKFKNMDSEQFQKIGNNARVGAEDFDIGVLTEKLIHVIEQLPKEKNYG